ncbi:MAG TPA: ATP-binding protein [Blastocatellia bacterium]
MGEERKQTLPFASVIIPLALGAIGYGINCLPVEIFPGVVLIFGSAMSILAAVKLGPAAGGVAGLIAGMRTWTLWPQQPFPFSALLYCLEGVAVGYLTRNRKRGAMPAVLIYWLTAGATLGFLCQWLIVALPARTAIIWQLRSILNGLLAGMAVEVGLIVHEIIRRRRAQTDEPPSLRLISITTVVLTGFITLPLLYISVHNVNDVRERMMSDLAASSSRSVRLVEDEAQSLLNEHRRGMEMAVSLFNSPDHRTDDIGSLQRLLSSVRRRYPGFAGMSLADSSGRTVASDPPTFAGIDHSNQAYYRDLIETKKLIYSEVYRSPDGRPAVAIAAPMTDERGSFNGFVLGWFDINVFQEFVSQHRQESEALTISDRRGGVIADSSLQPGEMREVDTLTGREDFDLVAQQTGATLYYTPKDDGSRLFALKERALLSSVLMPATGWKVWSVRSLAPISEELQGIYFNNLIVLMGVLFVMLGLSSVMARWLANPINDLQQNAASLAEGKWAGSLKQRLLLTADFDSLFASFRRMAERIKASWERQQELLVEASVARSQLEATFDAMTDVVAIIGADDRLIRANRAYYKLMGLSPEEAVGQPYTDIAHRESDWQDCEACRARREGRQALVLFKPEDASGRYLEIRVDPVYNGDGERIATVQVLRDLTEIRRAEAEAEKAGALIKELLEEAYDAVYATDTEGRFLWANRQAMDLFAEDGRLLEGELFLRLIHTDDLERVRKHFLDATSGQAQRYEYRYLIPGGGIGHLLMTNSPIYEEETVVAVLCIARDVTQERVSTEQAMRNDKLRALGQLASGVAHNFNNSLTAVLGYTQMVMGKIEDATLKRHLKTVEMAALDATKMVQRIQSFARQRKDENWGPVELNTIVRDALDLTRSRWRDDARAEGIEYDIIFRPQEGTVVMCDQSAMREVFVNLMINALDAMPRGGRLTITTAVENDTVLVTFADSGTGISEEVKQRIFEPFFTTKGAKGNGLGLAVSYGIVERHGGEIHVESEAGRGATFTLRMPIALDSAILPSELADDQVARQAFVLVVDDEVPIRALLANVLRARGHKVLMAEDGIAGLRAIEGSCFDLVITDISMPGLDGWTLVKEVRRRWPKTKVMVVTGYGEFVEVVVPGGDPSLADAFVAKPFDIADIDVKINELLKGRELGRRG